MVDRVFMATRWRTPNATSTPRSSRIPFRFWSAKITNEPNTLRDVFEVRMSGAHWVNYITMDVAHYPHMMTVQV
jgi:hypothetical protein